MCSIRNQVHPYSVEAIPNHSRFRLASCDVTPIYTSSIVIIFRSGCDKSSGLAMHPQNLGGLLLDLRTDRRGYARLPVDLMPPATIALLERHRVVARQAMGE
jgi:hypothetical protein